MIYERVLFLQTSLYVRGKSELYPMASRQNEGALLFRAAIGNSPSRVPRCLASSQDHQYLPYYTFKTPPSQNSLNIISEIFTGSTWKTKLAKKKGEKLSFMSERYANWKNLIHNRRTKLQGDAVKPHTTLHTVKLYHGLHSTLRIRKGNPSLTHSQGVRKRVCAITRFKTILPIHLIA